MNPSTELIRSEAPTLAIGAKAVDTEVSRQPGKGPRRQPHHGTPGAVEAHSRTDRNVKAARGLNRSLQLIGGRDGFDPDQINPAFDQPLDLLGKAGDRIRALLAQRRQNLTGRSDRPGDQHPAAGLVRDLPASCAARRFSDPT